MDFLVCAIGAMIESGTITFRSYSKYRGIVEVMVTSDVFVDSPFWTSIPDDEWNCAPASAVAKELSELVLDKKLDFITLRHMEGQRVGITDAVKVVRCKDCKYKDGTPGQPNILCGQMKDDDFCSYGESR